MTPGFPRNASVPFPHARRRHGTPVLSTLGMGAGQHYLVTSSILNALAHGGNAVDATIAGAWTASVVMPAACGVGGDLFAIVSKPGDDPVSVLSSGIGPRNASFEFMKEHGDDGGRVMPQQGPLSPAVPGFPAGIGELHRMYGTKPMEELAGLAMKYAHDGYPVNPTLVRHLESCREKLSLYPASKAMFFPDDRIPQAGELLKAPDLGKTIHTLAMEGDAVFYNGHLGEAVTNALQGLGGKLEASDFADHMATVTPPITTTYRDYTIFETGYPTPGLVLLEALNIVEPFKLGDIGIDSAQGIHYQVEALKLAFADRRAYGGDPTFVDFPIETLIGKPWADKRRLSLDPDKASTVVPGGTMTESDTTYLCAIDKDGMMVSMIISVSAAFGSCVVAGDTGIVLNNRAGHCFSLEEGHPNIYAPGKKTMHTLNCYMIGDSTGTPFLVGGTPGGDSQPQWNLQTITGLLDAGLDAQAATEVPRWSMFPATYPIDMGNPYDVKIEAQVGEEAIAGLKERGHTVIVQEPWAQFGSVQVISRDPETGVLAGGSDPRAEGMAAGI
ncbi:MAG: gamma-glutamyltransferase family protein [Thermomicrobiales bacterium]|nr:gamma-glutamyltransferase family protein [Thermomicrobiales bacterium]